MLSGIQVDWEMIYPPRRIEQMNETDTVHINELGFLKY